MRVGSKNLVPFAQEIDKIAPRSATGIQNAHAGHDPASQQLVKKINVDLAEFFLQGEWEHFSELSLPGGRRSSAWQFTHDPDRHTVQLFLY
jgi:hypothetical protein